jgi:hypothetical protein
MKKSNYKTKCKVLFSITMLVCQILFNSISALKALQLPPGQCSCITDQSAVVEAGLCELKLDRNKKSDLFLYSLLLSGINNNKSRVSPEILVYYMTLTISSSVK